MMRRAALSALGTAAMLCSGTAIAQDAPSRSTRPSIGSMLGGIAKSAQPETSEDAFARLLSQLNDEDFATREGATDKIASDISISDARLEQAAREGDLSPEAHARVVEALRRRFVASPRPAIGITMQQPGGPDGVLISNIDDRFPAFGVLQAGDIVVSIGGESLEQAMNGADMLRTVVMSYLPGEDVAITVIRAGERRDLVAALGRFEDLNQGFVLSPDALAPSWDIRIRRLGLAPHLDKVIEVSVPRGAWRPQRRGAYDPGAGGGLIAGGQASLVANEPLIAQASNGRWRDIPVRDRGNFRAAENPDNAVAAPAPRPGNALRAILLQKVDELEQTLRAEIERMGDPRLSPEQRAAMADRISQQAREIQNLRDQISRMPPG